MKEGKFLFLLLFLLYFSTTSDAQNNRVTTQQNIAWQNVFGTIQLTKNWGIHAEYQWRRENWFRNWQQSLVRVGINYQIQPNMLGRIGYGWIETYAYGDIPINGMGRDFTEHRSFQMIQLSDKMGCIDFTHRYMLEQRWVGRYSSNLQEKEDEFPLLHRMRYSMRVQVPLRGNEIKDKTPYFALFDEIFIGFGKNVNANIFDQNRLAALVGYRWNKKFRLEAGVLSQILQLGRQIDGKNVFQNNVGPILNANFTFDFSDKQK